MLFTVVDARDGKIRKCGPYPEEGAKETAKMLNEYVAKSGVKNAPYFVRPRACKCPPDACEWHCRDF